jgi:hypothetical protein
MKKALSLFGVVLVAYVAVGWLQSVRVTSAWNQKQYKTDGTTGAALPYIGSDRDGSTACATTLSDFSGGTDATADLTCANTGDIVVLGYDQATVTIDYTRSAGTVVNTICDFSNDSGTTWGPKMKEDANGAKSIDLKTSTQSVSGVITHNFDIHAELMRCRFYVTSGDSGDIVNPRVQLGRVY